MDTLSKALTIKEIETTVELIESFPVMKQLRTDLTEESYIELFQEMKKNGYQLFALFVENEIVSLAGIGKRINFYNKHHIYIYDLITSSSHRSKGYGERLLSYIHTYAKEIGVEYVALESGINRSDAHRFYETKLNYDRWCYSFRKKL